VDFIQCKLAIYPSHVNFDCQGMSGTQSQKAAFRTGLSKNLCCTSAS